MPRLFHRPPQYRRHKSTNQAVVSFLGSKIYLGPYGSQQSHERYQELLKQWETARHEQRNAACGNSDEEPSSDLAESVTVESLQAKRRAQAPITLSELILVYRRHTHLYYQKNGEVTREAGAIDDALRILRKHYGLTFIKGFGPVSLGKLRDPMIDELDWSRKYINKQVNRIRGMFTWGASQELLDPKVPASLKTLPGLKKGRTRARETERVKPVCDKVVDATIGCLPEVVADMVRLQRLTSARPGEICSLGPADIDTSGEVWIYTPAEHKTEHFEKDRIIAIGPRGQEILKPYLETTQREACCFSPAVSEMRRRAKVAANRKTPLNTGNKPGSNRKPLPKLRAGDKYTTGSYRRAIHRASVRAGVEKWSPNRIRHTASTEIRKRFGIDAARAVDGHGSANTTEIYAELDLQKAVQVMREVG